MITDEVKEYIEKSVLCWLATCNNEGIPNVSPKELFTYFDSNTLLIANIISPNSVENIKSNSNVCVSFVDIFIQKGYKLKGKASIILSTDDPLFDIYFKLITGLFTDKFPIHEIIEIKINTVHKILAPSYVFNSDITENSQIKSALETYKINEMLDI